MKELEILLENYWIIKDEDKELYYRIKDSLPGFKSFLTEKLGYHIIVNPYVIKLEKLPGVSEEWMGIEGFESPMEYVFLCLLLMFLEDRGRDEQFVLSSITEFIQGNYPGEEKVDWTLFRHRRCLIKVLRFAADIGMIKVDDGDDSKFTSDESSEVLYESTGLSRYFVRNFSINILNCSSYRDIENEDLVDIDRDRGIVRRQRVYRRLVMSPVIYNTGAEDMDYAYIKNFKGMLENDMEKYLEVPLHVHRNGALLLIPEKSGFKGCFPQNKTISDIVLQMNCLIRELVKKNTVALQRDDTAILSMAYFESLINRVRDENRDGWSKEYREMGLESLNSEIISYMKCFNMIEVINEGREIKIMPLCGKIAGCYPKDFIEAIRDKKEAAADAE